MRRAVEALEAAWRDALAPWAAGGPTVRSRGALLLVEWDKIYLAPSGEDLIVNYSFVKEGQPAKNGKVEIKDPNKLYGLGYFQSLKAATHDYLTAYDNFYKNAGKMVLDKIVAELESN
jgi:hypothetical protein